MFNLLSSFVLVCFLFPSVSGFGVSQQHHARRTNSALHAVPIDTHTSVEVSNAMHSMWVATIDADVANIELEAFRKVFAGGIAVMIGGLISTTLLGTIIDKKDLYANLAAESYADMAEDPEFWRQMTEGMSPEEKEKAKELMERIKADKEGRPAPAMSFEAATDTTSSGETEASSPAPSPSASSETPKDEAAKASNDMFSDY